MLIRKLLREGLTKEISKTYLKGLLNNTSNKSAHKFLRAWINRGPHENVSLSDKEYEMLQLIKTGGINPRQFSSKN